MLKTLTTKKTHQPNTVSSNTHATTKTTNFKIKIKNRLSQRRTRRLLCVQDTCALTQNTQHTSPPIPQTLPQTHTHTQKTHNTHHPKYHRHNHKHTQKNKNKKQKKKDQTAPLCPRYLRAHALPGATDTTTNTKKKRKEKEKKDQTAPLCPRYLRAHALPGALSIRQSFIVPSTPPEITKSCCMHSRQYVAALFRVWGLGFGVEGLA